MNRQAILHRGRGMDCCPLGTHHFRIRLRTASGDFSHVLLHYTLNKYAWHEERLQTELTRYRSDALYDYYQVDLCGSDNRLSYVFELHEGTRRWFFSEEGVSETYDFIRAYLTHFQYPFVHACDVHSVVSWADTAVLYQIFPERYFNGLGCKPSINTPWDGKPLPTSFFGGDLEGIRQKLGYLQDLGVNCLYLTPVFPSVSNHKYDIRDYYDVDADFGGKAALSRLIAEAHQAGMRVLLDGVFNHCSELHPFFQDVLRNGSASPYFSWFFVRGSTVTRKPANYLTFASVDYMPKLNTGHPAVIDYFCKVGAWWIREYGIDGWRLDVMDEIAQEFLRAFRKAVKAANPDALIIGELWHEPESYLRGDQLDGVMNYGLTKACMDYLVFESLDAAGMRDRLCRLLDRTPIPASQMMMNLLGCHDTDRFLTLLQGDTAKLKIAFSLLFFFVGLPCIYYGDEIGMEGGYDPDCRRTFPWEESRWNLPLRTHVKTLCALRRSGKLSGSEMGIEVCGSVLLLTRNRLRLLVNASKEPASYAFKAAIGTLPPVSCLIEET